MRKVQVSEGFLCNVQVLLTYIQLVNEYELCEKERLLCAELQKEIDEKIEARLRREVFTNYKTSEPGTVDREAMRQKYLDLVGMNKDWRSNEERTY